MFNIHKISFFFQDGGGGEERRRNKHSYVHHPEGKESG
jgi:hypothetical protein